MKPWKEIKALPNHLQPKILSAVAYINECSPDMKKAVERINTCLEHLSDKEMTYVMSLLVFDKIIDMVKQSEEMQEYDKMQKGLDKFSRLNAKAYMTLLD